MGTPIQKSIAPLPYRTKLVAMARHPVAVAINLVVMIVLAIAAILVAMPRARADSQAAARIPAQVKLADLGTVTSGEMRSGALLLKDGERFVEAPQLGTDIDLTVSGPTARARISQIFRNPTQSWVEAVYVYPLPDGGAVDTLKMVVGDRIIVGDVKERGAAKVVYEQAKARGQKAALIEQERPNIFTNSVANIGPGETVVVQIEYQEPVRQSGNEFSLRVPLVVAPRYNPAPLVQTVDFNALGQGWGNVSDPVPDRERIEPAVLDPRVDAPVNPVAIKVNLQAGFPLGDVKSHHHAVKTEEPTSDTRVITLDDKVVPADRDFELTWKPAATTAPSVGLFREHVADSDYLLAFVTPPALVDAEQPARPREVIFVIDNSGSMGGTSITQAKASLLYGLDHLKPADRFNVIRFDNTMDVLFPDSVPADSAHLAQAKGFVSALDANGGTEMVPPMKAALTDQRDADSNTLRQVIFLTDGEIGNEQQLFDTIAAMRGRSRLYMVGIGSAPNTFLMTRASEIGRGTFTHIGSVQQVEERMRSLFDKLENPIVTNLTASYSGGADITPAVLPDLYRGEPVVLAAKLGAPGGTFEIRGRIGDRPWMVTLPVANAAEGRGLSKLWARRKITDAEVARTLGQVTPEDADKLVLSLALDHHLVSRLTSLVAIDETPSRPAGARLARAELPLNLPAGWDFDKVFGGERTSPSAPRHEDRADAGGVVQVAANAKRAAVPAPKPMPVVAYQSGGIQLPKTATDAELRMIFGLLVLALSLILLIIRRLRPQPVK
jgi:Ca-activated chloride channel family protein